MERNPVDKFPPLMNIWEMNIRDFAVMDKFMPPVAQAYRMFGNFLGEKSFSIRQRHRMLSYADHLQFERAKRNFASGEQEYFSAEYGEARKFFTYCLWDLQKVRFFHRLSGLYPFDESEYYHLYKLVNYWLARSLIEAGGGLKKVREYLLKYLELEEDEVSLNEFESYIIEHKISYLPIQLFLYDKQGRHQDIIEIGNLILKGQVKTPDLNKADMVKMFSIMGNAYQRMNYPANAIESFRKSIKFIPSYVPSLLQLRENYLSLHEDERAEEIEAEIERTMPPKTLNYSHLIISKDREFSHRLYLAGKELYIDFYFEGLKKEDIPLITIEFNREVVWDNYLEDEMITLSVEPKIGENILYVKAASHPFLLKKFAYRSSP
ncbi:MAG: hypothetical protein JSV17_14940 [Candidatus Aminicenantes bacterium]|nr:MAG: hypothetical protein JSV17_14940 [Candidatus Aminicenantes bacterium]